MRLACAWSVAAACALFHVACSSADPVPDFTAPQASSAHGGGKTPAPPTTTTDGADAGAGDAAADIACKTVPPNDKCGLDPQCGCGNDETCDVTNTTTGATSCVTAGGGTLGRQCVATGDCLAGLTCQYGVCRPYCSTPNTSCTMPGTGLCTTVLDQSANPKPVPNVKVCTIDCDPRMPQAVCGTNACIWFPTYYAPAKVSDCNFAGTTDVLYGCAVDPNDPKGAPLTYACKPGNACGLHPTYGYECERWCRIGNDSDCAGLQAKPTDPAFHCKDVYGTDAPVINGVKEGLCQDS